MKDKENLTRLAQNLYRLRHQLGLTQQQVANAVGVKRSTYAYYERNTTPPTEVLERIAKAFGVAPGLLLFPDDTNYDTSTLNDYTAQNNSNFQFRTLSSDEQNIVLKYRLLDDIQKVEIGKKIDDILDVQEEE